MRRFGLLALFIGLLIPLFASAPAHAQATRTWVSGVGDDANPCSRTAPCKTFAGAISKTAPAGEINCLDPGGFGAITITKSISLNCHEVFGSVLVAGTNGIVISAASTDKVSIRNLDVQGLNSGIAGIKILSAGVVTIEDCVIQQFTQQGIADVRTNTGGTLLIKNTLVSFNGGAGVAAVGASVTNMTVDGLKSFNNAFGIAVGTGNNVTAKQSDFSGNATAGVEADSGGQLTVDNSAINGNGTGVMAGGAIRLSNSNINFNNTAFSGTPTSYGTNRVFGNVTLGSTPTTASQQ